MSEAYRVVISKSEKRLEVLAGERVTHRFPIGIGKAGRGPKRRRGDQKTPEGTYQICVKNPRSRFHLSLGLNYPNLDDARAGLEEGIISPEQFDAIAERLRRGDGSDWGTPMGGEIYIHGELAARSWSEGCVRMYNADVQTLFALLPVGTTVTIMA